MTRKVVTVVGARPQFIKAAAISRSLKRLYFGEFSEVLVHTGQHYDPAMSQVFFDELDIPKPDYNLAISGGSHGEMTGRMLVAIEKVLIEEKPDWLLIYGDTNSTLAGALAAAKLHVPVAHVEAGLRSFNGRMPEEINRILSDRISTLLFCPTLAAMSNLDKEGRREGVHYVGDVMYDIALFYRDKAVRNSTALAREGLAPQRFVLATCHRAENTGDVEHLTNIVAALRRLSEEMPVVFPVHPRTRGLLESYGLSEAAGQVRIIDPLPYLDMIALEQSAHVICTDSGGVQKEAYFFDVPCVTMRDETEWVELVESGWNQLTGANTERICAAVKNAHALPRVHGTLYGDGHAAEKILQILDGQRPVAYFSF